MIMITLTGNHALQTINDKVHALHRSCYFIFLINWVCFACSFVGGSHDVAHDRPDDEQL